MTPRSSSLSDYVTLFGSGKLVGLRFRLSRKNIKEDLRTQEEITIALNSKKIYWETLSGKIAEITSVGILSGDDLSLAFRILDVPTSAAIPVKHSAFLPRSTDLIHIILYHGWFTLSPDKDIKVLFTK